MTGDIATSTVPLEARPVRQEWARLSVGGPPAEPFDVAMLADLPEPARRWLTRAIVPGTPLWRSVELTMHGECCSAPKSNTARWRPR